MELNFPFIKISLAKSSTAKPSGETVQRLSEVTRWVESIAIHFTSRELSIGDWVFFDLEMGYGTSHEDTKLPNLDDLVFFYGSVPDRSNFYESSLDLLLCGSTEHLLTKAASAGGMGSGTDWLYDLIQQIEECDARGDTRIPKELTSEALAVPRINRPEQVVRWVFDVIGGHHPPHQRARFQGFARVNLIVPESGESGADLRRQLPRLVVATPLFVQFASPRSMQWITRFRLHCNLCRRYGKPWWKWRPDLPPYERAKVYLPRAE